MGDILTAEDLRLFALRRSAAKSGSQQTIHSTTSNSSSFNHNSTSYNYVTQIDSTPDRKCPMHGKNGTYTLPNVNSRSRAEMARELRLLGQEMEAKSSSVRSSRSFKGTNSLDRRGSMNQHQQQNEKPVPRDVYRGKVDFKTILRNEVAHPSMASRGDERSRSAGGGSSSHYQTSSNLGSSQDYLPNMMFRDIRNPREQLLVETDFDFRANSPTLPKPEPNWNNPGRFRSGSSSRTDVSRLGQNSNGNSRTDISRITSNNIGSTSKTYRTYHNYSRSQSHEPQEMRIEQPDHNRPTSPRRVGFGEDVVFDFDVESVGGSSSTSSSNKQKFSLAELQRQQQLQQHEAENQARVMKPILRYSSSADPAVSASDFHVQIYPPNTRENVLPSQSGGKNVLPPNTQQNENEGREKSVESEISSTDTSSTETGGGEVFHEVKTEESEDTETFESNEKRTQIEESESKENEKKKFPPFLADWNRSQSFPPPKTKDGGKSVEETKSGDENRRRRSLEERTSSARIIANFELESVSEFNDMVDHENEALRDRVCDLEKRVHDQNDEITCLRATLADALRRINTLESSKAHVTVQQQSVSPSPKEVVRLRNAGSSGGGASGTPGRRYQTHESVSRRASYASNRDKVIQSALSRKSVANLYQSTNSLHSEESASMSPGPGSPSPTQHQTNSTPHRATRSSTGPLRTQLYQGPGLSSSTGGGHSSMSQSQHHNTPTGGHTPAGQRSLSGSMSNLSVAGGHGRNWGSNSDFRRMNMGSMHSLRSPFGSQQNLSDSLRGQSGLNLKHGTKDAVWNEDDGSVRFHVRGRLAILYAPSAVLDDYQMNKVTPAPAVKPKLEWVYGYRGRDARSNLYLLPTGEMVYFVAAVVVLFNAEEHTQRHYLGHTEDVKCLTVHPNKLLIASGQTSGHDRREGKPHIRIWNSVSLQTLHVIGIGDFERAVVCLSFSKADGGNLLVAVDEGNDHSMSVWDWSRGEKGSKISETKCSTETVVAAEFHPLEAGTIVSIGRGHVNFWTIDSTALTLSRKTGLFDQRDKPKYVTCLAFSFTGDVITGDSNGNIFIWGRGYNAVTKAIRKVHEGPIFSVCVLKDGSIVTGGGKDRRLVQFDAGYKRTGLEAELPDHLGSVRTISQGKGSQLVIGSTRNSILQGTFELNFQEIVTGHVDEVWTLAVHPTQNQFLTAGHDQHIHLWDSLSHRAVWSSQLGDQAQSATFNCTGDVVVVGMTSGRWMVLDSQTREVYAVLQDGHDPLQTVKFCDKDKMLALGSRDGIVYVYQVAEGSNCKKFNRMGRCLGHNSPVTHLDWSVDGAYIRTNSADCEVHFWNASTCRPVNNTSSLRDVEWRSSSCPLSFSTIGVWPENADGTDLNACARSKNSKLLATGDDFGKIKLYNFPVSQPKSLHHSVGGHSSHVARLDFLPDDSRLISVGGKDTTVMQWIVQ